MPNLELGSGQQRLMSTVPVASGAGVGESEDKEEGDPHLFKDKISIDVNYSFPDYRVFSGSDYGAEGIIMQLVRLANRKTIVLTGLQQKKNRVENRKKVYADRFTSHANKTANKPIGRVHKFVQI